MGDSREELWIVALKEETKQPGTTLVSNYVNNMAMTGNSVTSERAHEMANIFGGEPWWGKLLRHDKVRMLGVTSLCYGNAPTRNWNEFSLSGSLCLILGSLVECWILSFSISSNGWWFLDPSVSDLVFESLLHSSGFRSFLRPQKVNPNESASRRTLMIPR
jgi:hypothetical protein